jgi:hypothetical protein
MHHYHCEAQLSVCGSGVMCIDCLESGVGGLLGPSKLDSMCATCIQKGGQGSRGRAIACIYRS